MNGIPFTARGSRSICSRFSGRGVDLHAVVEVCRFVLRLFEFCMISLVDLPLGLVCKPVAGMLVTEPPDLFTRLGSIVGLIHLVCVVLKEYSSIAV